LVLVFLFLMSGFLVQDIDCMPFNPLDNMPEALRRHIDDRKDSLMPIDPHINGNSDFGGCENHSSPVKVHTSSSALVKLMHGKVRLLTTPINVLVLPFYSYIHILTL